MSNKKVFTYEQFSEYLDKSESAQELVMWYTLDHGIVFTDNEFKEIFDLLCYCILTLMYPLQNEKLPKINSMINDLIVDMDVVTSSNYSLFLPKMCKLILRAKDKKSIMPSFKHLCDKFPQEIKTEYMKQKTFHGEYL